MKKSSCYNTICDLIQLVMQNMIFRGEGNKKPNTTWQ